MTPDDRFAALVDDFVEIAGVTPPTGGAGFGSHALRADRKIFTMLVRDRLVVKLPAARVSALVDAGEGVRFDANKGTPMKEWLALDSGSSLSWHDVAREALGFVSPSRVTS